MKKITTISLSIVFLMFLFGCGDPQKDFDEGKLALSSFNLEGAFKKFMAAAKKGHPEAQFNVAECYMDPKMVNNPKEALKWYKKSANNKYPPAMLRLYEIYKRGDDKAGVKRDYKQAVNYLGACADTGNTAAVSEINKYIDDAPMGYEPAVLALKWATKKSYPSPYARNIRIAARDGSAIALDWCAKIGEAEDLQIVGYAYEKGLAHREKLGGSLSLGYKQDLNKAFNYYKKLYGLNKELGKKSIFGMLNRDYQPAADWVLKNANDSDGISRVAEFYLKRNGAENEKKAFELYKKLYDINKDLGKKAMSKMVDRNYKPAVDWILGNVKDSDAILKVANFYLGRTGAADKDEKKAFELLSKISEENAEAMFILAGLYEQGIGCKADTKLYVECLKKSCAKGNNEACYTLATLYKDGKYVQENKELAISYFSELLKRSVSKIDNVSVYFELGDLIMSSEDAVPDFDSAINYFSKAVGPVDMRLCQFRIDEAMYFKGGRVSFKRYSDTDNPSALFRYAAELYYDNYKAKESVAFFTKAAEKGSVLAKYYLGLIYSDGKLLEKDETKARQFFKDAFDNRDKWRQKWSNEYHMFLAQSYEKALGCDADKTKAYNEYLILAKRGNAFSQYKVAEFLRKGIGVEKNTKEAFDIIYSRYKKYKESRAAYELGRMLIEGDLGKIDTEQALNYFKQIYDDYEYGARANFEIGCIYFYGKGVKQDYKLAENAFYRARNLPEGELLYTISYENHREKGSTEKDVRREVFPIYQKYAEKFPLAKMRLARAYRYGYGTPRDVKKAAALFAEFPDDCDCTYELGMMYFDGLAVEQNDTKAYELFKKAMYGSVKAEYQMVVCLMNGIGCEKDTVQGQAKLKTLMPKLIEGAKFDYGSGYQKVHFTEFLHMLSQIYTNGWASKDDAIVNKIKRYKYHTASLRYDMALDEELSSNTNNSTINDYEGAAKDGEPLAFVRLAAYVGKDTNKRNLLLDKAIEIGCRDAYMIKAGKASLRPFGKAIVPNNKQEEHASPIKQVNDVLHQISTGLKLLR